MSTDLTLKQALADMETAWRRLREVLDGPDVAAALVEGRAGVVKNMESAPRDESLIYLHFADGSKLESYWGLPPGYQSKRWVTELGGAVAGHPVGWSWPKL